MPSITILEIFQIFYGVITSFLCTFEFPFVIMITVHLDVGWMGSTIFNFVHLFGLLCPIAYSVV